MLEVRHKPTKIGGTTIALMGSNGFLITTMYPHNDPYTRRVTCCGDSESTMALARLKFHPTPTKSRRIYISGKRTKSTGSDTNTFVGVWTTVIENASVPLEFVERNEELYGIKAVDESCQCVDFTWLVNGDEQMDLVLLISCETSGKSYLI